MSALVIEPDVTDASTGFMLYTHGWGGNRFQHEDKMTWASERFNLITISVEFRQSGYDFDSVQGRGACVPYDAGHYQVLDVLNGLRQILAQRPHANRRRIYHYGGSQGGQIALLSGVYAPDTFSWIYVSCPLTHLDPGFQRLAGRYFAPWELMIRNPLELANRMGFPVYLEYGTADTTVNHEIHARPLSERLRTNDRLAQCAIYEGGGHDLKPATTKLEAFQSMSKHLDWEAEKDEATDFEKGTCVWIPCGARTLKVDWSHTPESSGLMDWTDHTG